MTNPLLARSNIATGYDTGPMQIGDTKTWHAKDKVSGEITKTFTLRRTGRPYIYDLCDAYNEARTRDDAQWYVTPAGELKIGEPLAFTAARTRELDRHAESERLKWKAAQQTEGVTRR